MKSSQTNESPKVKTMEHDYNTIIGGYERFKQKYTANSNPLMQELATHGQQPPIMVIGCCDSRVDPAIILQCAPGDIFTVRNIANLVPPYQNTPTGNSVRAALEYGVCQLKIKELIILGHSQCGGIDAAIHAQPDQKFEFIGDWVSQIHQCTSQDLSLTAQASMLQSYNNCLTYPWIKEKVSKKDLNIRLWFFDIEKGEVLVYSFEEKRYSILNQSR